MTAEVPFDLGEWELLKLQDPGRKGTSEMRLLHAAGKTSARFDDPNLVSHGGLVCAARLAENVGLEELVDEHVRVAAEVGANPGCKVGSLLAGMVAGADDIDGMDLLRHGALPATFGGIRAPSTLGSFLRAFDHGNVSQLAAVHRRVLARLAAKAPLLAGADALAFVDVDSIQRRVYGTGKQGAAFGHAKIASKSLLVRGLNALVATVSSPAAAPVVAAARLRGGNAAPPGGARPAWSPKRSTPPARPERAASSWSGRTRPTTPGSSSLRAAGPGRTSRSPSGWTPRSPARSPPSTTTPGCRSSTRTRSGTRRPAGGSATPRSPRCPTPRSPPAAPTAATGAWSLRRVTRLNPHAAAQGQGELFATYRYHAVFTDSPFELAAAESDHRGHAVIEQTFADLLDGALAHLPDVILSPLVDHGSELV